MVAEGTDGESRAFNHPFVQACSMFIGEMLCLLAFKLLYFYHWRKNVSIFLVNVRIYNMVTITCIHILVAVLLTGVIIWPD
jgi:hypothetical protein